ncbi:unnamed protein product [Closterium sp. NIES-65]|nr:unnamed protein product [Closterium sp. NIES-65]
MFGDEDDEGRGDAGADGKRGDGKGEGGEKEGERNEAKGGAKGKEGEMGGGEGKEGGEERAGGGGSGALRNSGYEFDHASAQPALPPPFPPPHSFLRDPPSPLFPPHVPRFYCLQLR